jgi:putative ABC transport system permease protein
MILSEPFWRRRFGGVPDIVGKRIRTADGVFEVVGILPAWFAGLNDLTCPVCQEVGFWLPASASSVEYPGWLQDRGRRWHNVIGRLRSQFNAQSAEADVRAVAARLESDYPVTNAGRSARLQALNEGWRSGIRPGLVVLLIGALSLLLTGCANIGNLSIARGEARRGELALRLALGANKARLAQELLMESLVVALVGGLLGLLISFWLAGALAALSGVNLPAFVSFNVDFRVLAAALVVTAAAIVVSGLAPIGLFSRAQLNHDMRELGAHSSRRAGRIGRTFIAAEVALTFVLLTNAILMIRSFRNLESADPGFDTANLLVAEINPNSPRYQSRTAQMQFITMLRERLENLPNDATFTIGAPNLPPRVFISSDFGRTASPPPGETIRMELHRILPNFFSALRIPLLEGRAFDNLDRPDGPLSVVISESVQNRLWPGESALGKRLYRTSPPGAVAVVIGVVADVRYAGVRSNRGEELDVYYSLEQMPATYMTIAVRTDGSLASMVSEVRGAVQSVDPELPLLIVSTVDERFAAESSQTRFHAVILGAFAAAAFLLSAVGVYGTTSYSIGRRKREIGIRLVVGANGREIIGMVVGNSMTPIIIGLLLGMLATSMIASAMSAIVFGVSPLEASTLAFVIVVIAISAGLASYVPVRRLLQRESMQSLREQC